MDLKEMLIKKGVVKIKSKDEEPFALKSGKESRLLFDVKEAILNPEILERITSEILSELNFNLLLHPVIGEFFDRANYLFDRIASVAIGGIPIATSLSLTTDVPQIIVRSEKHDRGTESQVIGNCRGKSVILIEDTATTGGTIVNAVLAIRAAGGICRVCVVVVDREEGALLNCNDNGILLYPLLRKSDFEIK